MENDPLLYSLIRELKAGKFRPNAIKRFISKGITYAINLAWSLESLRHSFYMAEVGMACILLSIGIILETTLDEGLGLSVILAEIALFISVFGLTLLQLGLVRAESSGKPYDTFVFPNILTLLRLLLIPFIVGTMIREGESSKMACFLLVSVAVITDTLDGTLSRRLGLTSDFGRIYDPVIDLLFHSSMAITLYNIQAIPSYFMVATLVRFFLPPVAGFFLYLFSEPFRVKSTIMGKVSSLFLSLFLMVFSGGKAFDSQNLSALASNILIPVSTAICILTTIFFLWKGIRIIKTAKKHQQ